MNPALKRVRSNFDDTFNLKKPSPDTTQYDHKAMTTMNSFDSLTPMLETLCEKCATLSERMNELKQTDESIVRFNNSFGAFLYGLSANSAVTQWQQPFTDHGHDTAMQDSGKLEPYILTKRHDSGGSSQDTTRSPPPLAKTLKFVAGKIDIGDIMGRLPYMYREQSEYRRAVKIVLRALGRIPEGMNLNTLVDRTNLPKHRVNDCLNAVTRIKDVVKFIPKGQLTIYRMNPTKYPSI